MAWMALGLVGCASAPPPSSQPVVAVTAASVAEIAEDPPPARAHDPVRPAADYLDRSAAEVSRRARMAFHESIFAVEPVAGVVPMATQERAEASRWESVAVVEERPASLRLLLEEGGIRLVGYVADADLHPVVRRRSRASLGAYRPPVEDQADGVWVMPGLIARPGGGVLRTVSVDDPLFAGEAWVARTAIDRVYEVSPAEPSDDDAWLRGGAVITTESGSSLVTVPTQASLAVHLLKRSNRRARVRYVGDQLWVEGWVNDADVTPAAEGGFGSLRGFGSGSGWGRSHAIVRYLHAGDALQLSPDSETIGRVLDQRVRAIERRCDPAGCALEVHLGGWSFVDMWIGAADARFGDAWEQVYLDRVRVDPLPSMPTLPIALTIRYDSVAACWEQAMAGVAPAAVDLQLTWKSGQRVDVPLHANLSAELHDCLQSAFSNLYLGSQSVSLPVAFSVRLKPVPLPPRPSATHE